MLRPLAIGALAAAGVSLLTTLPAVTVALRARRVGAAVPAILLLDLAVLFGLVAAISMVFRDWPPWPIFLSMGSVAISFFAFLTVPLLLLRRLGYRLYWDRR